MNGTFDVTVNTLRVLFSAERLLCRAGGLADTLYTWLHKGVRVDCGKCCNCNNQAQLSFTGVDVPKSSKHVNAIRLVSK